MRRIPEVDHFSGRQGSLHTGETVTPEKQEAILHKQKLEILARSLIALLEQAPVCSGENEQEVTKAREEIKKTFEAFPQLIPAFAEAYRSALTSRNVQAGKMSIYMVGGRTSDKPLKANSDLDLIFAFENPPSPSSKSETRDTHLEPSDWRVLRKNLLENDFQNICTKHGIPNHGGYPGRFQILNWGENTPEEVEGNVHANERIILLLRDDV